MLTGAIYVVDELDYEHKQNYELVIRATDSVSGVSAEVPVSVLVQDVNDSPPEFESDSYNVSVSEGASFGSQILKVLARDNDTGINQMVTYAIQTDTKNSSEYFHMDPQEGVIYLKKSLDHELDRAHHFTVIAADKGVPSLSSTAHVWVTGQLKFLVLPIARLEIAFGKRSASNGCAKKSITRNESDYTRLRPIRPFNHSKINPSALRSSPQATLRPHLLPGHKSKHKTSSWKSLAER